MVSALVSEDTRWQLMVLPEAPTAAPLGLGLLLTPGPRALLAWETEPRPAESLAVSFRLGSSPCRYPSRNPSPGSSCIS